MDESFDELLDRGANGAAFDALIAQYLAAKEYGLAFEARLMKKRFEMGLPLIQSDSLDDPAYQAAVVEVARETGRLFLEAGNLERAWPYFRAISEPEPIFRALDRLAPGEGQEGAVNIAFQEGVHPSKGIELILGTHGMCRALTAFGMNAVAKDRDKCIALLTSALHAEVVDRMARAIEAHEGVRPDSNNLTELMSGREWLFGEWDYYVDTSHVLTIVPYCVEVADAVVLRQIHELCDYGKHLSPQFQSAGNPPFEKQFEAYDHYVLALLGDKAGENTEDHLDYFRRQIEDSDPELVGDAPGRVLVQLLISLGRTAEALDVLLEHVFEDAPYGAPVPSALQLCYQAKDFARMTEIAHERGDLLSYAAAKILSSRATP
jgi:hypothetical protein